MRDFGRASLLVYWIHVEIVYGVLTTPLHRSLPLAWSYAAFIGFTLLMFGAVILRPRISAFSRAQVLRVGRTRAPEHLSTSEP
jgi:hypothetical protein